MEEAISVLGKPLVAHSLSDRIVDLLIEAMVRGDIPPGARIREATLARQFGISRGPLREALGRLEGRKMLHYTPNFGMRVVSMSTSDLCEIFELREVLEGLACRLATERMTDAQIDDLERLLEEHRHSSGLRDGSAYYQQAGELDFHYRIAVASGNKQLVDVLCRDLYHLLRIHRFRSSSVPGRAFRAFDEHMAIVKAMRARDGQQAEIRMREHVRCALESLRLEANQDTSAEADRSIVVPAP